MAEWEKVINGLSACAYKDCRSCPYWGASDSGLSACKTLAADALALLKAQQQPRVMTLEEMDDLRGRGQTVYIQDRDAAAKCEDAFFIYCEHNIAWFKGETYTLCRSVAEYGETWRCWTSRPTDEQREAEQWLTERS